MDKRQKQELEMFAIVIQKSFIRQQILFLKEIVFVMNPKFFWIRNVHKINSTTKPDLAGSKENLPGQNQVWTLFLTCQVLF